MTAMGALRCLHARKIRVPEDVSIVGFDDLPISPFLEPPLTTVRQPKGDMGRRAATMLLQRLKGSQGESKVRVPGTLVIRESTSRYDP
jgi:DNA-binding LacI/PurR family transcriptional regulator